MKGESIELENISKCLNKPFLIFPRRKFAKIARVREKAAFLALATDSTCREGVTSSSSAVKDRAVIDLHDFFTNSIENHACVLPAGWKPVGLFFFSIHSPTLKRDGAEKGFRFHSFTTLMMSYSLHHSAALRRAITARRFWLHQLNFIFAKCVTYMGPN